MFEKIYGHEQLLNQLRYELTQNRLPGGLLFYGAPNTGKLTTALEIVRILMCEDSGREGCTCQACRISTHLRTPYLLFLGSRDPLPDIIASIAALRAAPDAAALAKCIRAVQICILRYHPAVLDQNDAKSRQAAAIAAEIDGLLYDLEDKLLLLDSKAGKQLLLDIETRCKKLVQNYGKNTIPVHQIRAITQWIYTTPESEHRVIIIEGIDTVSDASKNALLKILEEPPANVLFILISERAGTILPTITSRVRKYYFAERDDSVKDKIIRDCYKADPDIYDSLDTFFLAQNGINLRTIRDQAEQFLYAGLRRKPFEGDAFPDLVLSIEKQKSAGLLMQELISAIQQEVIDGIISPAQGERLYTAVSKTYNHAVRYNQGTSLLLEATLYTMMELA